MMEQEQKQKQKKFVAKLVHSFSLMPTYLIEAKWDEIEPHLLYGKSHWVAFYSIEQFKENLILGRQQLWCYMTGKKIIGVVVTQLDLFPAVLSLRFQYMGGKGFKPKVMMKCITKIELWAMQHGATVVDFLGRDAWRKLVPEFGYVCIGSVFRKELVQKDTSGRIQ